MYCDMLEITDIYCERISFPDGPFMSVSVMQDKQAA